VAEKLRPIRPEFFTPMMHAFKSGPLQGSPMLGTPFVLNRHRLPNRVVHAPMSVCYADENGMPGQAMIEHYARRARGGAALVIVENVAVSERGRQLPKQPLMTPAKAYREPYRTLARAIHEEGALGVLQIAHAGRYAGPWENYDADVRHAPSAASFELLGRRVTPTAMTLADIEQAMQDFEATARLALEAGFDGVELHGAAGLLIAQFMSPRMNHRTDIYGGNLENRCRFALELARRVRAAIGGDALLGFHLFADELHPEGSAVEDACWLAQRLEEAGCDFLMPSLGSFETLRLPENAGLNTRPAYQMEACRRIKQAVSIPVIANGGLGDPQQAEQALLDGSADLIGLARPLFKDPDWARKVLSQPPVQPDPCTCRSMRCLSSQKTGGVCEQWPAAVQVQGYLGRETV